LGVIILIESNANIIQEIRAEWEQFQQEKALISPSPFFIKMRAKGLL